MIVRLRAPYLVGMSLYPQVVISPLDYEFALPVLFRGDMVRAILRGQKSVTRRPFKLGKGAPYGERVGQVLYVRETSVVTPVGRYAYRSDGELPVGCSCWTPSIHMPKERARLWLRVVDVSVWPVLGVDDPEARREGFASRDEFLAAWAAMYGAPRGGTGAWRYEFETLGIRT